MRTIERTHQFKKDYRKLIRNPRHARDLPQLLAEAILILQDDKHLPPRMRDHALSGTMHGFRDCHLKPDVVLIYALQGSEILQLVRLGSHSEVFK